MAQSQEKTSFWIVIGISLGAILLAYMLSFTNTINSLELKLVDMRFDIRGPLDIEESPIVIVKIDDQSDGTLRHRWPWPRAYYASIIQNLNEAGAKVIGIDVMLDKAQPDSAESDDELARALEKYENVVLVGKMLRSTIGDVTEFPPYHKFRKAPWGLVAVESDIDGFYRKYRFADSYNDSIYASFAALVLKHYYGNSDSLIIGSEQEYFAFDTLNIPKFSDSGMLINFHGPAYSFQDYSFDEIVDDEDFDLHEDFDMDSFSDPGDVDFGIPPGLKYSGDLKDKIVLIGATMFELHDNFPTPFLTVKDSAGNANPIEMPGVELHANAIQTVLDKNFLHQLPQTTILVIMLILVIITYLITRFLPTLWSSIATIIFIIGFVLFSIYLFTENNLVLEIVNPVLVIAFSYVGHTLYHYLQTQQEKKVLRGAFAHYVPEKVVQELMNNPDKLQLGGEERVVTVMFSDVAGFTTVSEKLTPHELVVLLNEYLTAMTNIVLENNGIIDKYEGDAIMAEFGMPVPYEDHPHCACRTALLMQEKLIEMRKKWKAEGRPELEARIGINTGNVIVGNMGSQTVFDYTVMGDSVNLGARLEGANKVYDTFIMISEFTNDFVKNDFYTRPLDLIRVKGKNKPVEVFELIGERTKPLDSKQIELLSVYQRGVQAYRERKWNEAIDFFDFCLNLNPEDSPSKLYRKRSIEFKFNDPGEDWDGVFTMTTK
ncbi:MAG: CHASE2 domain-containing protein [Calditrichaeota bacterium]|nr:MAG: CHASE2 domain-containing protein [Calditrichota bacterium]MBL1205845.1 CHASE2 domain-containing protein [Calditrichota bacterium]NOG45672.1 CHASE2 domain-containing protein [Calditrichota bacterium]